VACIAVALKTHAPQSNGKGFGAISENLKLRALYPSLALLRANSCEPWVWSCRMMGASANDVRCVNGLPEDAVREIEQIHSRWIEFEIAGEDHSLMALCALDIELWAPDAKPLLGCAAVSAWMARATTRIHSVEITERRIRGSNEIAYLTTNYKTTSSLRESSTPDKPLEAICGYCESRPVGGLSLS